MNCTILIVACLLWLSFVHAQPSVNWSFLGKKISDTSFEIHMIASIQSSRFTKPECLQRSPINIISASFNSNPVIHLVGPLLERGYPVQKQKNEYKNDIVDFIQKVSFKANYSYILEGKLLYRYISCRENEEPPEKISFSMRLE